jgi:hypothetical protein
MGAQVPPLPPAVPRRDTKVWPPTAVLFPRWSPTEILRNSTPRGGSGLLLSWLSRLRTPTTHTFGRLNSVSSEFPVTGQRPPESLDSGRRQIQSRAGGPTEARLRLEEFPSRARGPTEASTVDRRREGALVRQRRPEGAAARVVKVSGIGAVKVLAVGAVKVHRSGSGAVKVQLPGIGAVKVHLFGIGAVQVPCPASAPRRRACPASAP